MMVRTSVTIPSSQGGARSTGLFDDRPFTAFFSKGDVGWRPAAGGAELVSVPFPKPSNELVDASEKDILLTERQLECLSWISQGKSSTDIGAILNISGRTVDYHVGEICQRLNVRTRMQAVAYAVRRGWLKA